MSQSSRGSIFWVMLGRFHAQGLGSKGRVHRLEIKAQHSDGPLAEVDSKEPIHAEEPISREHSLLQDVSFSVYQPCNNPRYNNGTK